MQTIKNLYTINRVSFYDDKETQPCDEAFQQEVWCTYRLKDYSWTRED